MHAEKVTYRIAAHEFTTKTDIVITHQSQEIHAHSYIYKQHYTGEYIDSNCIKYNCIKYQLDLSRHFK